jgi:hypothetical protein
MVRGEGFEGDIPVASLMVRGESFEAFEERPSCEDSGLCVCVCVCVCVLWFWKVTVMVLESYGYGVKEYGYGVTDLLASPASGPSASSLDLLRSAT